jgi:hypothetical protein
MRALAVLAVVGCFESGEPAPFVGPSCSLQNYWFIDVFNDLDVLFVIDDSPAMAPYQQSLEANAPVFIDILQAVPTHLNLSVAVARASDGSFVDPVPCGAQAGSHFLWDYNGDTIRNFTGTLRDVFACLTRVGSNGSSQQVLASASQTLPAHPDFLRDGAFLLVVLISAQDDGSPADPLTYANALNALTWSPNHVIPAAITRIPSSRLQSFVDSYGSIGKIISIDQSSWADALGVVSNSVGRRLGRLCLDGVLVQPPSCTVTRLQYAGTPMQQEIGTMPPCNPQGQATGICAALIPDAACPVSGTKVALCYDGFDPNDWSRCYSSSSDIYGETVTVECAVECGH